MNSRRALLSVKTYRQETWASFWANMENRLKFCFYPAVQSPWGTERTCIMIHLSTNIDWSTKIDPEDVSKVQMPPIYGSQEALQAAHIRQNVEN